jgi:mono/diheme cytochrome c family protein
MLVSLTLSLAMQTAPLVVEVRGLPTPRAAAPDVISVGRMTYGARCQMCHGADGNADTPIGRAMKPPPRRFSDSTWQAKVSDADIAKVVLEGGAAVKKSPAMPAFKDLAPTTQLTPLIAFVRSLGAPAATVTVMAGDTVVTMSAPVEADGVARVRFPGLKGPVTVMGLVDEASLPYCTIDVAEAAGAVVRCDRTP